jgi:hypothetical protein
MVNYLLGPLEIFQFLPQVVPNAATLLCIHKPNKRAAELGGKQTIDLLDVYFSGFICRGVSRRQVSVRYAILSTQQIS